MDQMTEKKKSINLIDDTINAIDNIKESLQSAKQELEKLEEDKEKLSNETKLLESEKIQLEEEKRNLEQEKILLEQDKEKLMEATRKLEQEKEEKDQKIGDLTSEQMKLLDEYKNVKKELEKLSKIVEDQEEFNIERIKALLSIYNVLLEEIWQGTPHFRILLTLHGEKEEMSRDAIKNTTGIAGAMVLRAIHELANIDLLEYNEETDLIKLKKRLFKREDLTEKDSQ